MGCTLPTWQLPFLCVVPSIVYSGLCSLAAGLRSIACTMVAVTTAAVPLAVAALLCRWPPSLCPQATVSLASVLPAVVPLSALPLPLLFVITGVVRRYTSQAGDILLFNSCSSPADSGMRGSVDPLFSVYCCCQALLCQSSTAFSNFP
jgi:hypothetical protein